jgi:mono/diheme cytochrome c family protein
MRKALHSVFAAAVLATFATAHAEPAGSAERGKALFMKNTCFSCHGTEGQGGERGAGPKLAPDVFPYAAFEMQLRNPRGVMPRYPEKFVSEQDAADIHAYLMSIRKGPDAKEIPALSGS